MSGGQEVGQLNVETNMKFGNDDGNYARSTGLPA